MNNQGYAKAEAMAKLGMLFLSKDRRSELARFLQECGINEIADIENVLHPNDDEEIAADDEGGWEE